MWARLSNDNREYNVQLSLDVFEGYGQSTVPEIRQVQRINSLIGGIAVEDGNYDLEYSFDGKPEKNKVRVANGRLLNTA